MSGSPAEVTRQEDKRHTGGTADITEGKGKTKCLESEDGEEGGAGFSKDQKDLAIEEELFQASDRRISHLCAGGVTQGQSDISEPERDHVPALVNMEEYEDWSREAPSYAIERRLKGAERDFVGEKIDLADIQKDVTTRDGLSKKCRHAMFIGAAGMGKTTLMRRLSLNGRRGRYKMLEGKLIFMLDFRAFSLEEKIVPSKILLGGLLLDSDGEKIKEGYHFLLENSENVVYFIDSLDTLPFDLEKERIQIGHHEPAPVDVILHNLLAGDLFPKSSILSSSREYKVRNMHSSVRPDRCVVLDGLREDSVNDLIDGFLGKDRGMDFKKHIESECPEVRPLFTIPVFLVLSVVGFVHDGFKPKTMSGILIKFFHGLIHSSHVRNKSTLLVLKKLMPLSFEGIRDGRSLFTPDDLHRFGLIAEQVTDLGILIPQSQGVFLESKLIQNERFFLYFNHQTQQECLASLHVLSLNVKGFRAFIEIEFYEPRCIVVRRIVCGVLLNDEVLEAANKLTKISDVDEKRAILLASLSAALRRVGNNKMLLELLIDLNEGKDGASALIRSSVHQVALLGISLSPSDIQAIGSIITHCEHLDLVLLNNCNLTGDKMQILARTVMKSNVEIDRLHVGGNDLEPNGMLQLGKLAKHSKVKFLRMGNCRLESQRLEALAEGAFGLELTKLDVAYNENMGHGGMFHLGKLLNNCKVEDLDARSCSLESKHLKRFSEGAGNAKPRKLYFSDNPELGPEGMHLLGKFAKDHQVKELIATRCNPTSEDVKKLAEGLGDAKVEVLFLGDIINKPLYCNSVLSLLPHVKKELDLMQWQISDVDRQDLQNKLDDIASSSLTVKIGREDQEIRLKAFHKSTSAQLSDKGESASALVSNEKSGASGPIIGDDSDPISSQIDRRIKTASIKCKTVGPEGGFVENFGCKVTFPRGAFDKHTNVETSVITDLSDCPEGRIPIAPIFGCNPPGKLNRPALLEMEPWVLPTEEDVYAEVFWKDVQDREWQFLKEVRIEKNHSVSFYVDHFTLFELVKECASWAWSKLTRPFFQITFQNLVYINGVDQCVACVSCLKDRKTSDDVTQILKNSGYRSLLTLPEILHAPRDAEVKVGITCIEPENLRVILKKNIQGNIPGVETVEQKFLVNAILEKYHKTCYVYVKMDDDDLEKYDGMLMLNYMITADGDFVEHLLQTRWPINDPRTRPQTNVHFYGDVRVGTLVLPSCEDNDD